MCSNRTWQKWRKENEIIREKLGGNGKLILALKKHYRHWWFGH